MHQPHNEHHHYARQGFRIDGLVEFAGAGTPLNVIARAKSSLLDPRSGQIEILFL